MNKEENNELSLKDRLIQNKDNIKENMAFLKEELNENNDTSNSKDLKSFPDLYKEIYNKLYTNHPELFSGDIENDENKKLNENKINRIKNIVIKLIIMFIAVLLLIISVNTDITFLAVISMLLIFISLSSLMYSFGPTRSLYNRPIADYSMYTNEITLKIFESIFPNTIYDPKLEISEYEYKKTMFNKSYDIYESSGLIESRIDFEDGTRTVMRLSNITLKEIVIREEKDIDGNVTEHKEYEDVFRGDFLIFKLPSSFPGYLNIVQNKINLFGKPKDKLEMDMSEFEKYFDINTSNRLKATQFLDLECMKKLIEFVSKFGTYEINIINDIVYVRVFNHFFSMSFKDEVLNYDVLKSKYNYAMGMKDLVVFINERLNYIND